MKLLHHPESELSRKLLETIPAGVEVVDGALASPDYPVSAYPSVVVVLPAKEVYLPVYDTDGGLLGVELTAIDEREVILRMPTSWEAVHDYINFVG